MHLDGLRFVTSDTHRVHALRNNFVHAPCQDLAGNLWLSTSSGGVTQFDEAGNGPLGRWQTDLPSDTLDSIAENPADGSLWLGTRGGLLHFQHERFFNYGRKGELTSATI